jgi:energy-coupling factor transporter ATP-binding protein EcfA2
MNVNELIPPFTLDDVVGRDWYKEILKQCTPEPEVDQYLKLDSIWPVAICGQPGCGKRTLAVAFAGTAAAAGRRCFLLNGSDLPEDIPSIREEFRKLASSMNGTQTVVILEGCGREAVWEALARELENPESDLEQLLLEAGSDQKDLYGFNILYDDGEIEYDSLINPPRNREAGYPRAGRDVADPKARQRIREIVEQWIEG